MSQSPKPPSNLKTILFVVCLCCACATALSALASVLKVPQERAALVDRSKQTLFAAQIMHYDGYFLTTDGKPAKHTGNGILVPGSTDDQATGDDIIAVFNRRIKSALVTEKGSITSFEKEGLDEKTFVEDHWKDGYTRLPLKLVYLILPEPSNNASQANTQPIGYILPVSGFGLWDRIIGYLALEADGVTVRGVAWYWHRETPGLGGDIVEPYWQEQFTGKKVFEFATKGELPDLRRAPAGITVVRGSVEDVYGDGPKSMSAVDGLSGATLTGNGVTKAYQETIEAYRSFLIEAEVENEQSDRGRG